MYKRARYYKMRIEIYLLYLRAFSREATSGRFHESPNWRWKKGEKWYPGPGNWGGICGYLENSIWKLGCTRTTRSRARRRIKGGTNWINVLSRVLRAQDGYTTVCFKLKRPWACRWHGSLRMFLSSDLKVQLIFLIEA